MRSRIVQIWLIAATARSRFTFLTLSAFTITFGLTFAIFFFLLFAPGFHFFLCLAEQAQIVFGMLLEIFGRHAIIRKL